MHALRDVCVCVLRMHPHRGMRVRIFVRSLHVFARDVAVGCMWRCVMRVTMQVSVGYAYACMCLYVVTCVHACHIHMHAYCAGMDENMCSILCRIIVSSIMCVRVCEMCVGMHACYACMHVHGCMHMHACIRPSACMHGACMPAICVHRNVAENMCARL